MRILPVRTPTLKKGDDLVSILLEQATFEEGDILVISSKAVATAEGAAIDLRLISPTEEAKVWAKKTGSRSPAFLQAVLNETERMTGTISGVCPGAILTEVRPKGLSRGSVLTANAGLDESNVQEDFCIGWPRDPIASARLLRLALWQATGKRIAVIITDSCCRPRRLGVTAFALTVSGIDPLASQIGREDLFGKKLHITTEAIADQLATAANFVMGNAGQSVPAAIIRDHGLTLSDFEGWVPGIEPKEDLFRGII